MRPVNAVLVHHDPAIAQALAQSLEPHFRKLVIVRSFAEAEAAVARVRARFVIADLELLSPPELQRLCSDFPASAVTCVHRLADELMWSEVLAAGAVDCCLTSDVRGILQASERYLRTMGAAA
jgi:hypothetical protein